MPRLRYRKPPQAAHDFAAHVMHTALEASPDHAFVVTHLAPTGEVALEIVHGTDGIVAEVYVGKPGDMSTDEDIMELVTEAVDDAHAAAEAEAAELAALKAAARGGEQPTSR